MKKKRTLNLLKSTFSIKLKVAILCTAFILIAVTVSNSFLLSVGRKAITSNTEAAMKELAQAYSKNITDTLNKINESTNILMGAASGMVTSNNTDNSEEASEAVNMFLNMNSSYEKVNFVNTEGTILYSSDPSQIGENLSQQDYFKKASDSKLPSQTDVFLSSSSKEACITIAVPIRAGFHTENSDDASGDTASDSKQTDTGMPPMEMPSIDTPVEDFTGVVTIDVKASEFGNALSDINVEDYKSSYAFLLDGAGNYIAHPDTEFIGTKTNIKEINEILQSQSTISDNAVVTYNFNGVKKYAGYQIEEDSGWILFITAEQSEILSIINDISGKALFGAILLVIILMLLTYLFAGTITKSIKSVTFLINKTAELDFTEDTSFQYLTSKKDETGEMSRAIEKMRSILKSMILHISEVSGNLTESSKNLNTISYSVNDHAADNSATAEQLSASMEETAATTEHIYSSIEKISASTMDINSKTDIGAELSVKLIEQAMGLKSSAMNATEKTKEIYREIKSNTDHAIEQSKAVEKINLLTNTIKEIASQTSLLALNASIEAARAGDAGKGFSVVAVEISHLADQSSKTVGKISDIVDEIYQAVANMTMSLEQSLQFLEKNVLEDYKIINENNEKYSIDANTMHETMDSIHTEINHLNTNVKNISDSIAEINTMVSEASMGINEVAEKNSDIVALTTNTRTMAKSNTEYAEGLKEIVGKFML